MTQDEIMRMAREAGLQPYYDEQVTAIARFAAIVAATEREKCTNTQEFVTLPREVVEQAIRSLERYCFDVVVTKEVHAALRTALEQPQNHIPDAGNMAPAGWKLVPVEPTREMLAAACRDGVELNGRPVWKHTVDVQAAWRWGQMLAAAPQPPVVEQHADDVAVSRFAEAMKDKLAAARDKGKGGWDDPEQCTVEYLAKLLVDHIPKGDPIDVANFAMMLHQRGADKGILAAAAAPQPPTTEDCSVVQQQGEQDPVAFAIFTEAGNARMWSTFQPHVQKLADAEGLTVTPLYTNPHPKREPLTNEQIDAVADAMPGGLEGFMKGWGWRQFARAVLEATHNIK